MSALYDMHEAWQSLLVFKNCCSSYLIDLLIVNVFHVQVKPERRIPQKQQHVWTRHVAGERLMSAGGAAQHRLTDRSPQEVRGYYI